MSPIAAPVMTVWVAAIEHSSGTNITVHTDEAGARAQVAAYARRWWDQEMVPDVAPDDEDELVETYFERMFERGESYVVDSSLLYDGPASED
jgi:hypothetical protein